ncbi:MAG: sugar ABC transporter substrate-binding protein [Candidatus Omnitrophica bacterium]|nr:sugar ABC transporter substrate-binding protein [Candidatus Omnitrophota bacterium]
MPAEQVLTKEGRSLGTALGTARELSGRVIGNEALKVRAALLAALFVEPAYAAEEAGDTRRARNQEYVSGLEDGVYKQAYGQNAEFAVIAADSEDVSREALAQQLAVNPLALAVIVTTNDSKRYRADLAKLLGNNIHRVILADSSIEESAGALEQALMGKELWQKARALVPGLTQTMLQSHTAIFASSDVLEQIENFGLASKLVSRDRENFLEKRLASAGISPEKFRRLGNAVAYLIAKKGGFTKLQRQYRSGLERRAGTDWIYVADVDAFASASAQFDIELAAARAFAQAA